MTRKLTWLTPLEFRGLDLPVLEPPIPARAPPKPKTKHWKQGVLKRVSLQAYNHVRLMPGYEVMTPDEREEKAKNYDLRKMRR